jgi:hypothetical protein
MVSKSCYIISVRNTFDWRPFVTTPHVEEGDQLVLAVPSRLHTFRMPRRTPLLPTYRLLGVYQAEGSKSEQATDFSLANSNPRFLAHIANLIKTVGFTRDRLSLELLREARQTKAEVRKAFACVDVEVVAERIRSGKGGHAGVLHVRKSLMLLRTTRNVLTSIFVEEFPSKDTAREYVLGWLDGDGSIIDRGSSIDLMLAGLADEHAVVKRALTCAFGWIFERGSFHKDTKQGTQITLRAHEMLDLIDAPAFTFSMNRARLLVAFDRRTQNLRAIRKGEKIAGAFVRWGLCKKGGVLTELGERICSGHARHAAEIEKARKILAAAPRGVKGLAYP